MGHKVSTLARSDDDAEDQAHADMQDRGSQEEVEEPHCHRSDRFSPLHRPQQDLQDNDDLEDHKRSSNHRRHRRRRQQTNREGGTAAATALVFVLAAVATHGGFCPPSYSEQATIASSAMLELSISSPSRPPIFAMSPRCVTGGSSLRRHAHHSRRCRSRGSTFLLAAAAAPPSSSSSSSTSYTNYSSRSLVPPPGSRMARWRSSLSSNPRSPSSPPPSPPSPSSSSSSSSRSRSRRSAAGRGSKGRQLFPRLGIIRRGRTDLRYAKVDDSPAAHWSSTTQQEHAPHPLKKRRREDDDDDDLVTLLRSEDELRKNTTSILKLEPSDLLPPPPTSSNHVSTKSPPPTDASLELDYQRRKSAWAAKYADVSTLRRTFGSNRNRLWGDFDPTTTRRLYHALLPRALLSLHDMGRNMGVEQQLDELAPLAYEARKAAKSYARERSMLPGRLASMAYDGFRTWRRYGRFDAGGMSWEQVWTKYEDQVLSEVMDECGLGEEDEGVGGSGGNGGSLCEEASLKQALNERRRRRRTETSSSTSTKDEDWYNSFADLDDEELTARICLRILERSVVTNEAIDRLFQQRLIEEKEVPTAGDMESGSSGSASDNRIEHDFKGDRRERRRSRRESQIRAELNDIEEQFDCDIRELLRRGGAMGGEEVDMSDMIDSTVAVVSNKDAEGVEGEESRSEGTTIVAIKSMSEDTSNDDILLESSEDNSAHSLAKTSSPEAEVLAEIASALFPNEDDDGESDDEDPVTSSKSVRGGRALTAYQVFALRILATTKKRIADLQHQDDDDDDTLKDDNSRLTSVNSC